MTELRDDVNDVINKMIKEMNSVIVAPVVLNVRPWCGRRDIIIATHSVRLLPAA